MPTVQESSSNNPVTIDVPLSVTSVPRLRHAFACRLVFTQGHPTAEEGCRPASWGLSLALLTCIQGVIGRWVGSRVLWVRGTLRHFIAKMTFFNARNKKTACNKTLVTMPGQSGMRRYPTQKPPT